MVEGKTLELFLTRFCYKFFVKNLRSKGKKVEEFGAYYIIFSDFFQFVDYFKIRFENKLDIYNPGLQIRLSD